MKPTATLKHEHQIVLLILGAAEAEAQRIRDKGRPRSSEVTKMLDFFRNFVDRCHHGKEEKHLFPRLAELSKAKAAGPIAVLLAEHEIGRQMVRTAAAALPLARKGDPLALASLADVLAGYAGLLRSHIAREDDLLFPLADRLLAPKDQRTLARAFDRVEAEEMGEGVHEKYHAWAHELAER